MYLMDWSQYAVKAQTSLAPLSRFRGSRITTAHEQQCRFQNYVKTHAIANEIDKRNWQSVNHIPGIHDNGPRDHGLWRLTLTAYNQCFEYLQFICTPNKIHSLICESNTFREKGLSAESQKGAIADQRCSVENQKGAIAIALYCFELQ